MYVNEVNVLLGKLTKKRFLVIFLLSTGHANSNVRVS